MGTPIAISLEQVWKFLSPILEDKTKEKLRKKESSQIAKEKVFDLYESLGKIKTISFERVDYFRLYTSLLKGNASQNEINEIESFLNKTSNELINELSNLTKSLEKLYPQLEIHNYDLYEEIDYYRKGYGAWFWTNEIGEALIKIEDESNFEQLDAILLEEEENCKRIEEALKNLREFISSQFSFLQSF